MQHKKDTRALSQNGELAKGQDKKTGQDFSGYPHGHAKEKLIKPETRNEKKTAALNVKDGEKMDNTGGRAKKQVDEQDSDGSGGAFSGTESVND